MPYRIHQLTLTQFRNHAALRLATRGAPSVILTGPNGAGKTNVLEAISLLSPGRGLRGTSAAEYRAVTAPTGENWAVAAEVETSDGLRVRLATTSQSGPRSDHQITPRSGEDGGRTLEKRSLRLDGKPVAAQAEILAYFSVLWLTPQMEGLFLDAPSARRRFFDRLVSGFTPAHAARLARYEKNMRSRLHLLVTQSSPDAAWLDQLESALAQDSIAITATRRDVLARLEARGFALQAFESSFPLPRFLVRESAAAPVLEQGRARDAAEWARLLKTARAADRAAGSTALGAHRDDVAVFYADKNMPAAQSSTGEQKALLLSIILAQALFLKSERGSAPVLLLDEIPAHLDDRRRVALFALLSALDGQVWMTGTNIDDFAPVIKDSVVFDLQTPPPPERRVAP